MSEMQKQTAKIEIVFDPEMEEPNVSIRISANPEPPADIPLRELTKKFPAAAVLDLIIDRCDFLKEDFEEEEESED